MASRGKAGGKQKKIREAVKQSPHKKWESTLECTAFGTVRIRTVEVCGFAHLSLWRPESLD